MVFVASLSAFLSVWLSDAVGHWAASGPFITQSGRHSRSTLQGHSRIPLVWPLNETCLFLCVSACICVYDECPLLKQIVFGLPGLTGVSRVCLLIPEAGHAAKGEDVELSASQLDAFYLLVIPRGKPEVPWFFYLYDSWKCIGTVFGRRMCLLKLNQYCHWQGPSHSSFHLCSVRLNTQRESLYIFLAWLHTLWSWMCPVEYESCTVRAFMPLCSIQREDSFFFTLSLVHQCSLWLCTEWYLYPSW